MSAFLEIIQDEHSRGKTIFMSSHMFEELKVCCDRVALISDGHIENIVSMDEILNPKTREYKIEFASADDYTRFKTLGFNIVRDQEKYSQFTVELPSERLNDLFRSLNGMNVKFISEVIYNLEKYFREKLNGQKGDDK